jgi:hypothetical protein
LAKSYGVEELLLPLFEYVQNEDTPTPTKEQAMSGAKPRVIKRRKSPADKTTPRQPRVSRGNSLSTTPSHPSSLTPSPLLTAQRSPFHPAGRKRSASDSLQNTPDRIRGKSAKRAHPDELDAHSERYRAALMAMFLNEDGGEDPPILAAADAPRDLDVDLVVDDQGHTSLHWAAALSRIHVLRLLLAKGACVTRKNENGETALMRAVMVTNAYDHHSFPMLLEMLAACIFDTDNKSRTLLHHIVLSAGGKGKSRSSRYYLEYTLEFLVKTQAQALVAFINIQDKSGDTALNLAAKIGSKNLAGQLLDVGASPLLANKAGLRPEDFGVEVEDHQLSTMLQHSGDQVSQSVTG